MIVGSITLIEINLPEVGTQGLFMERPEANTIWASQRWLSDQRYSLGQELGLQLK